MIKDIKKNQATNDHKLYIGGEGQQHEQPEKINKMLQREQLDDLEN